MPGKFSSNKSAKTAAKAKTKKRSLRYGGIKGEESRPPFLGIGGYRLRVTKFEEGEYIEASAERGGARKSVSCEFEVVATKGDDPTHAVGDIVAVMHRVEGDGSRAGRARLKTFATAAAGYDNEEEFDEVADGALLDALLGFDVDDPDVEDATLLGRLVDVEARRGNAIKKNDVPTGEHYTNCTWSPVSDDEQEEGE